MRRLPGRLRTRETAIIVVGIMLRIASLPLCGVGELVQ
jgi:hypothetical protein